MSEEQPVGSVGVEAAKLLGALADWAGESSTGWARQLDEHLATGAPECQLCPICRTVHVIREAGPEVRDHLVTAVASLAQAAAGVLAASARAATESRGEDAPRPGSVQRIDLDDDEGYDDEGYDDGTVRDDG